MVLRKSLFFLKQSMQTRWSQRRTVQSNTAAPFILKQKNANPLCYKLNLAFRIHISYKQNQKRISTITKTIIVQDIGQFGWNSFKRLLTNRWKLTALRSPKIKISSYSCDAKDIRCRAKKKGNRMFSKQKNTSQNWFLQANDNNCAEKLHEICRW